MSSLNAINDENESLGELHVETNVEMDMIQDERCTSERGGKLVIQTHVKYEREMWRCLVRC